MRQVNQIQFNAKNCTIVKALTVKNPYAFLIQKGKKKIEVRSRNTSYRGRLFITSSQSPEIREMKSGFLLCSVDLYKTKPVNEFTEQDYIDTCIDKSEWGKLHGFGWFLKNVEETELIPTKGQLGIYNLYLFDERLEYIMLDEKRKRQRKELIVVSILVLFVLALAVIFLLPFLG